MAKGTEQSKENKIKRLYNQLGRYEGSKMYDKIMGRIKTLENTK